MKCIRYRVLFVLSSLCSISHAATPSTILYGTSFLNPRSQSTNGARDALAWHELLFPENFCTPYGAFAVTFEYMQSYRPYRIAQYFFSTDVLTITGSEITDRNNRTELLADYFGLSQYFDSTVAIKPVLKNALADIAWYGAYYQWYWYIHAPVTWNGVQIILNENIHDNGIEFPFPAGYMDTESITAPYASWSKAMMGFESYGQVERLRAGKIPCNQLSRTGLSEIQISIGYAVVETPYSFAGFHVRGSIPTGNRPTSEFLLEPVIGNGKHGEIGLGFIGNVLIWEKDGCQAWYFYTAINGTTLLPTRQQRSFDITCNGFLSRYMLLKEFDNNLEYTGKTLPAINVTTIPCTVNIAFELDAVFMFAFTYNSFEFDIGYNAWLRSHENIDNVSDPFADHNYGIKGIQNVINPDDSTNATQSTATIGGNLFSEQGLVADTNPPIIIPPGSLNLCSAAAPMAFTHKIFWSGTHYWDRWYSCAVPFIALGGEVEFEGQRPKDQQANKNSISQWGILLKGGVGW